MARTITIEFPDDTPDSFVYAIAGIIDTQSNALRVTASGRPASVSTVRERDRKLRNGSIEYSYVESFRTFAKHVTSQIYRQVRP